MRTQACLEFVSYAERSHAILIYMYYLHLFFVSLGLLPFVFVLCACVFVCVCVCLSMQLLLLLASKQMAASKRVYVVCIWFYCQICQACGCISTACISIQLRMIFFPSSPLPVVSGDCASRCRHTRCALTQAHLDRIVWSYNCLLCFAWRPRLHALSHCAFCGKHSRRLEKWLFSFVSCALCHTHFIGSLNMCFGSRARIFELCARGQRLHIRSILFRPGLECGPRQPYARGWWERQQQNPWHTPKRYRQHKICEIRDNAT